MQDEHLQHSVLTCNWSSQLPYPLVCPPCFVSMSVRCFKHVCGLKPCKRTLEDTDSWLIGLDILTCFFLSFLLTASKNTHSTASVDILYVPVTKSDPFPWRLWGKKTYSIKFGSPLGENWYPVNTSLFLPSPSVLKEGAFILQFALIKFESS